ncbi:MAG TPA: R3H domain-containing nucleic acid-binding protein [Terriglobales bacterium]|nr:R3H domain-containing nucleic acid-binding protein [Terriglobales bacterium]
MKDKVAAANQVNDLLKTILGQGGFKLKYRITVNPPQAAGAEWAQPDISVDFAGPHSTLLMDRGGELLNAFEHLTLKALRLENEEHDRLSFDCRNSKAVRREELRMAAEVAAERVRKTSQPYHFAPMNSRERRMLHMVLGKSADLRTESEGEGSRRCVILYPKDYKTGVVAKPFGRSRR